MPVAATVAEQSIKIVEKRLVSLPVEGRVTCMTPPPLKTRLTGAGLRRLWFDFEVIHNLLHVFHFTGDLLSQIFFLLSRNGACEIYRLVLGFDTDFG